MAAPMDAKHTQKQLEKKLRKMETILSTKERLVISKQPTRVLCVQNGGLGNNVSQTELIALFTEFGDVDGVIMMPRKSYSFISYTDVTSASQALHHLNGHMLRKGKDPTQDVILYLLYVEKASSTTLPSNERPPGLHIVEDFVSEQVEEVLLKFINADTGFNSGDTGVMKHRQVKHFGYEFKYDINDVDIHNPLPDGIPPICCDILHRIRDLGLIKHIPDQLTVNQYKPGQGIPPHVDTVEAFEDGIVSLSLGSQTVMDFRHPDGRHLTVLVPRRSVLVMTGESRYVWSHGITPRKSDVVPTPSADGLTLLNRGVRTSFTFRKVVMNRVPKSIEGDNADVGSSNVPNSDVEALALEKQHVHKVYDDIAEHFSGTRYKPWPKVADFMLELPPFSLVADVGCGNGKCLGINKDLFEIGCDYSSNLASICHSRGFETCVADVTCLPFCSSAVDVVLCIAVVHHMSTKERRTKAVSEVVRILRKGGRALIYVWAMEQNYDKTPSKYINKSRKKQAETEERNSGSQSTHIDLTDAVKGDNAREATECARTLSSVDNTFTAQSINIRRKHSEGSAEQHEISVTQDEDGVDNCPESSAQSELSLSHNCSKQLHVHVNRTPFKEQDMLVPWQLKSKEKKQEEVEKDGDKSNIFHRFYHVFRQGELEAVCKKVSGCVVRKSYYDQGNWCVVLEKV